MAYASAPASELALQLSAPANSLAVPPPAASTAEAVDLSPGAAILEDPGPAATRTRVQRLSFTRYFLLLHTCECVTCFVFFCISYFFAVFCSVRAKTMNRKAHIRTLTCLWPPTPRSTQQLSPDGFCFHPSERASCVDSVPGKQYT